MSRRLTREDALRARECLAQGGVCLLPTDTVYGLVCDAESEAALRRIYELKGRPPERPAAVMFFSLERALAALPELGDAQRRALQALLPGPLTLLLANPRRRYRLASPAPAGRPAGEREALGLRVPALEPALASLALLSGPVIQTSANVSGAGEARRLEEVPASLRAGVDLELDGGELPGVASTVLDLREYERHGRWRIVREGPVGREQLERVLC